MSLSRRSFLRRSAAVAAAAPLYQHLSVDFCDAAADEPVDFSGGFAPGAVRLNRNENPFGPSPLALQAIQRGLRESNRYVGSQPLVKRLAAMYGVEEDSVLLGHGSTELLKLIAIAHLKDGGNIVSTVETFRVTPIYAEKLGAQVRWVPHRWDWSYNTDALLAAVNSETKVFYLVNPNNPTGAWLDYDGLVAIADALPKDVVFFIDEAYWEFLPGNRPTGLDLVKSGYQNVVVTRTFSKVHGLAGLRIGYGIAHPDAIKKLANFRVAGVNLAGYGGALASLDDHEHIDKFVKLNQTAREFYRKELSALGIPYVSGVSPYVLADVGDAGKVLKDMEAEGVFVRPGSTWQMPRYIRISYGLEEENQAAIRALKKVMKG